MPLQDQVISIPFGQGVDSKTDPKHVVPGKFIELRDAVMVSAKQARKRNGYTSLPKTIVGGGTLSAPKMVRGFNGEIVCQDSGFLYGYSPSLQGWVKKGPYESIDISEKFIFKEFSTTGHVDCAVLGNYTLYAWDTVYSSANGCQVMIAVVDNATGSMILNPTVVYNISGALSNYPGARCVVLGGNTLAVFYYDQSGTSLAYKTVSITTSGVTTSSQIDVVNQNFLSTMVPYDVIGTATGGVASVNAKKTVIFNTNGTVVSTNNYNPASNIGMVSLALDSSTGNIWQTWFECTNTQNTGTIYFEVFSSSGGSVLTKNALVTGLNISLNLISTVVLNSTSQAVYWGQFFRDGTTNSYMDAVYWATASTGGIGAAVQLAMGIAPFSKPFTVNGTSYMVCIYRGPQGGNGSHLNPQATLFLIRLSDGAVVSRFGYGLAASLALRGGLCTAGVAKISSTRFVFACGLDYQIITSNTGVTTFSGGLYGAASVTFDFASSEASHPVQAGEILALNGGLVSMYDGAACTELGFHLSPEIASYSVSSGGSMADGSYEYAAVFQWMDSQGNLHQSEPTLPESVTVSGESGSGSVSIQITCPYLTQKKNVAIALFRTKAGGTVFFQITDSVALTIGNPTSAFVTITDTASDSVIGANSTIYTNGGVVDNSPPPASMAMLAHNNRLFLVDAENRNVVWYSKIFNPGNGLAMSASFIIQIDPKLGDIVGPAEMDEKVVFIKEQGICVIIGDGANDTGSGSTFTLPQFIPSEVGGISSKAIFTSPMGVLFQTPKGIYLLDRALGINYIGAEMEAFNGQSITEVTFSGNGNRILFLSDTGTTLVYDTVFNQWSTFTNHQGYSADSVNGLLVYARTDGNIYQENTTSFLDGSTSYAPYAKLAWLKLAGVQGFQRVRRVGLLGDYTNGTGAGHGVQISSAYDFGTSFSTPVSYTFGSASSSGAFQYRERLPIQKCDALQLIIEEVTTGASGEYVDFSDLSLEVGIKRGMNKLPAGQSVG